MPYQHCMGSEGEQPCCHAWLVSLSKCYHGDRRPVLLVEESIPLFPMKIAVQTCVG